MAGISRGPAMKWIWSWQRYRLKQVGKLFFQDTLFRVPPHSLGQGGGGGFRGRHFMGPLMKNPSFSGLWFICCECTFLDLNKQRMVLRVVVSFVAFHNLLSALVFNTFYTEPCFPKQMPDTSSPHSPEARVQAHGLGSAIGLSHVTHGCSEVSLETSLLASLAAKVFSFLVLLLAALPASSSQYRIAKWHLQGVSIASSLV